jgi:hypothetical protein
LGTSVECCLFILFTQLGDARIPVHYLQCPVTPEQRGYVMASGRRVAPDRRANEETNDDRDRAHGVAGDRGDPYGLATAAHAQRQGIETLVLGEPMSFWRENMPAKMMLRSGPDWHMDVAQKHTMMAFLEERGIDPSDVDPIPISLFLEYADWFRERAGVAVEPDLVEDLAKPDSRFEASLQSGRRVIADSVVAAPGISRFGVIPAWVERDLSPDRWSHTCNLVRFDKLRDERVLIVGGPPGRRGSWQGPNRSTEEDSPLRADETSAENERVRLRLDPETGLSRVSSIKRNR